MTLSHTDVSIDTDFLERLMSEVSAFGATPAGGLHRLTASAADGEARRWLAERFDEFGFTTRIDAVGNMYGVLMCAGPDAPVVLSGSHLDSQPNGGRFDGAFGVVSALAAVAAVGDSFRKNGIKPDRNLGVVNWTNEEGSRFAPSLLGSKVFAGTLSAEQALASEDGDGVSLATALEGIGFAGTDVPPANVAGYLEAHIEQGPILEAAGKPIGIVEGNWGTAKYQVTFHGKASHTGPTPMSERRDALLPAASLITFLRKLSDESDGELLTSVGRLDVFPNSTNVVAERVKVYAELRDIDATRLDQARTRLTQEVTRLGGDAVDAQMTCVVDRPARDFDASLVNALEASARDCGYEFMRMHTVAGHDAVALADAVPSAMLFVPSVGGISHNEVEFTEAADLVAGTRILARTLAGLACAGPS